MSSEGQLKLRNPCTASWRSSFSLEEGRPLGMSELTYYACPCVRLDIPCVSHGLLDRRSNISEDSSIVLALEAVTSNLEGPSKVRHLLIVALMRAGIT